MTVDFPNKLMGVGDANAQIKVYMQNSPDFGFANSVSAIEEGSISALEHGEVYACGQACGNGWRKVFNLYAKLIYALAKPELLLPTYNNYQSPACQNQLPTTWQEYRDNTLLRTNSNTALFFNRGKLLNNENPANTQKKIHIIMGRTYAGTLDLSPSLQWENKEFAVDIQQNIIVCPYFDYRQLSNSKLLFLVDLINHIFSSRGILLEQQKESM